MRVLVGITIVIIELCIERAIVGQSRRAAEDARAALLSGGVLALTGLLRPHARVEAIEGKQLRVPARDR